MITTTGGIERAPVLGGGGIVRQRSMPGFIRLCRSEVPGFGQQPPGRSAAFWFPSRPKGNALQPFPSGREEFHTLVQRMGFVRRQDRGVQRDGPTAAHLPAE
jgi:hypothetical protein